MTGTPSSDKADAQLESWKEIAAYLQRDVSTVRRWEKHEGLPVRRHEHRQRSSVYAIPGELDAWRETRQPEPASPPAPRASRGLAIAAVAAVMLLGSGWALWRSGVLHLPHPFVEAAQPSAQKPVSRRLWGGTAGDLSQSASTDGRLVVFTDWSTGDLAAIDLATGKRQRLTDRADWPKNSDFAQGPEISPDGRLVAYSWFLSTKELYELRIVPTKEGSPEKSLYRNPEVPVIFVADWSSGGRELLVRGSQRDGSVEIGFLALDSGALRTVKSFDRRGPGEMSLSPDGRYIAYDSPQAEEAPERDIFLLRSDGSGEVPLVRHAGHDAGPMWSPDGSRVLFFSDRSGAPGLWSVSVAEGRAVGAPVLVQANASQMDPLGLGRQGELFYTLPTGANGLLIAEMDLEAGRLLSEPVAVVSRYGRPFYRPNWSPDGRYLAYAVSTPGLSRDRLRVVVRDMETGREREMSQGFRTIGTTPIWRPDGRTVLVYGIPSGGSAKTVQFDVTNGSVIPGRGLEGCVFPKWSTTSDAVWCLVSEGLVRRQLDSGEESGRARFEHIAADVPLSPDGRWVAFQGRDKDFMTLNLAAVEGGERRELFRLESSKGSLAPLSWTPDSRYLLCSGEKGQVLRIPVSGGEARTLSGSVKGMRHLRVHPDGKRVAISVQEPGVEIWVLENFLPRMARAR